MYVNDEIDGEKLSCQLHSSNGKKINNTIKEGSYIYAYIHYDGYNTLEFIKKYLVNKDREELLEEVFDKGQIRCMNLETGKIEHFDKSKNWGISMVDYFDKIEPSSYTYFLEDDGKWYQLKNGKKYKI